MEGFDSSITSPYWQNLDLSLRAWLWGEEIKLTTLLQFSYIDEPEIEDKTYNLDYLKFYLKNQLPKYKNDRAVLKKSHFLIFLFNSSCGFFEAKRQFKTAQKWVEKNKYRQIIINYSYGVITMTKRNLLFIDDWKDYNKKGYDFVLQKYSAFGLLSYYWRLKKRLKLNYRKVIK